MKSQFTFLCIAKKCVYFYLEFMFTRIKAVVIVVDLFNAINNRLLYQRIINFI